MGFYAHADTKNTSHKASPPCRDRLHNAFGYNVPIDKAYFFFLFLALALVLRFVAPFLARFFSFRACSSTIISPSSRIGLHALIVCTEINNVQELADFSCG